MVRPWRGREEDARIRARERERERKSHKGCCTYRAYKWQCRLPDEVSCLCFSLVPPSPNDNPVRLCRVVEGVWCSFSSRRLALTPRHAEGGCHADPPRPRVIVAVCQERGKPSDDGVNWATIVPPPPLLFLSLLRDTRARWPLAPTRPWPSRGTKVARIALPSRNHEGVRVQYIYSELRSMVKDC